MSDEISTAIALVARLRRAMTELDGAAFRLEGSFLTYGSVVERAAVDAREIVASAADALERFLSAIEGSTAYRAEKAAEGNGDGR